MTGQLLPTETVIVEIKENRKERCCMTEKRERRTRLRLISCVLALAASFVVGWALGTLSATSTVPPDVMLQVSTWREFETMIKVGQFQGDVVFIENGTGHRHPRMYATVKPGLEGFPPSEDGWKVYCEYDTSNIEFYLGQLKTLGVDYEILSVQDYSGEGPGR